MPNLNEFLNKPVRNIQEEQISLEKIDGIRPCSSCDLNVEGALWDADKLLLFWECKNGHKNSKQVG